MGSFFFVVWGRVGVRGLEMEGCEVEWGGVGARGQGANTNLHFSHPVCAGRLWELSPALHAHTAAHVPHC